MRTIDLDPCGDDRELIAFVLNLERDRRRVWKNPPSRSAAPRGPWINLQHT